MSGWQRALLILSFVMALGACITAGAVYFKIQDSRQQAARDSCRGRNIERGIQRKSLVRQLKNIRVLPDDLFDQFQTTRKESIRNVENDIHALFVIDCKEYAKRVVQK